MHRGVLCLWAAEVNPRIYTLYLFSLFVSILHRTQEYFTDIGKHVEGRKTILTLFIDLFIYVIGVFRSARECFTYICNGGQRCCGRTPV